MKRSLRRLLPEAEPRGVSHLRRDEQFRGRRDHPAMDAIRSRPRRMSVTGRMCACCSPRGMAVLLAAALLATGPECLGTAAYAESGKGWAGEFPVITTARSAHSLSNEEAQRSLPVHLRGVVTYFDPDFGTGHPAIFIHDGTGGIFVDLSCKATCKAADQLFAGALLDVRGVSAPGSFGPIVGNSQFRLIGRASLPAHPPRVDFATLKTGAEDAQWVEVEGTVHRVIEFPTSVTVCLEMRDGAIKVTIPREVGATYAGLVDAKVRIHANAAPTMNAEGQMIGVHLQAPNRSAVRVIEPAPSDPFALPSIPIVGLLRWRQLATPFHRVHLRGNVTLQWPGSSLCIRDASQAICAETSEISPVALGTLVDVVGFVESDDSVPVVADAVFRIAGKSEPVAPQPTTANEILGRGFNFRLIQLDGLLIGQSVASSDATLLLSSGGALVAAILPINLAGSQLSAWKIGSRIRVTGICSPEIDTQNHVQRGVAVTKSFRILLRSPADITLLERPSWWTPAHAIVLLALALIATLATLGWVVTLRRRVEHQAHKLRESEQLFRHMAMHDTLTGLATRRRLQERLDVAVEDAKRRGTGLAVLMVDLDGFKEINDTYGHPAGDEVLRETANRLSRSVRREDTVARLGGDEFVVLLRELTDLQAAERIASIIVGSLAEPIAIEDYKVRVSASVGVCAIPAGAIDAVDLLKNADEALYHAKTSGRNRFQVYRPGITAEPTFT